MSGHIKDMLSQHWNTPASIVDAVRDVFGGQIDLDPCDNEFSITKPLVSFQLPVNDGLKNDWAEVSYFLNRRINVYCNPPFGRSNDGTSVADWVKKCAETMNSPIINSTVLLLPASTETTFWHEHIWPTADAICFIKGRVSFQLAGKGSGASTKGTAIIYWGTNVEVFIERFSELGRAIRL
jgi:phage N-6-adenine-methyltransferase